LSQLTNNNSIIVLPELTQDVDGGIWCRSTSYQKLPEALPRAITPTQKRERGNYQKRLQKQSLIRQCSCFPMGFVVLVRMYFLIDDTSAVFGKKIKIK
jgi:hypothetical protein